MAARRGRKRQQELELSSLQKELAECRRLLEDSEAVIVHHAEELRVVDRDYEKLQTQMMDARSEEWALQEQLKKEELVREDLERRRLKLQLTLIHTKLALSRVRNDAAAQSAVS